MENYSSPRSYYGPSDSLSILKTTPRDRNYMHVSNSNARNNFKHSDENLPLYTENSVLKERSVSPRNTPRFSHTNREFIPVPGNPQGIVKPEQFILLLAELERLTMINRQLMHENKQYSELKGLIPLKEVEKLLTINGELNEIVVNLQKKCDEKQGDSFLGDQSQILPNHPRNQNSFLGSSLKVSFKDDLQKEIETARKQISDLQKEVEMKSQESNTINMIVEAQKKEISALTGELESMKKNTESLQQYLGALQQQQGSFRLNGTERLNENFEVQKRQSSAQSNDFEAFMKKIRQLQAAEKSLTLILREKELIERKYYEREHSVDEYKKKYEELLLAHNALQKDFKLKMKDLEEKIKLLMNIVEQKERNMTRVASDRQRRGEDTSLSLSTQDQQSKKILNAVEEMKHEVELKLLKDLLAREREEVDLYAVKLKESKQTVTQLLAEKSDLLKLIDEAYGAEPGSEAYEIEKRHIRELQQLNDELANMFEKQIKENADLESQLRTLREEFEQFAMQARGREFVHEHMLLRYVLVCTELQRVLEKSELMEKEKEKVQYQLHIQLQRQQQQQDQHDRENEQQQYQQRQQHEQNQQQYSVSLSQPMISIPQTGEAIKTVKVDRADKAVEANLIHKIDSIDKIEIEKRNAQTDTDDLKPKFEDEVRYVTNNSVETVINIDEEPQQNLGTKNELEQEIDSSNLSSEIDSSDDEIDDLEFNKMISYRRGGVLSEERRLSALMQMKRFEVMLRQIEEEFKTEGVIEMNMVLGIDCTASNHYSGKRSFGGKSLHTIERNELNPYEQAFGILGSLIEKFDSQGYFPVYLFGVRDCPKDEVVPLWVDKQTGYEFLPSIDMVLRQYRKKIKAIKMGGYTTFVPLIQKAIKIATEKKKFIVLIILGDGGVTDVPSNVKAIIEAAEYPIGIIFVGLGDGDYKTNPRDPWHFMKQMESGLAGRKTDNFTFVTYRPGCDPNEFAKRALTKVPQQLLVSHLRHMIEIPKISSKKNLD